MRTIGPTEDHEGRAQAARLFERFVEAGRSGMLRDPVAALCDHLQLTAAQVHAIFWLGQEPSLSMSELSRRLGVSVKTVTGIVDRLESSGKVRRVRSEEDRRVIHVCVTEEGRFIAQQIEARVISKIDALLRLLDPPRLEALFDIFDVLRTRLEQEKVALEATEET